MDWILSAIIPRMYFRGGYYPVWISATPFTGFASIQDWTQLIVCLFLCTTINTSLIYPYPTAMEFRNGRMLWQWSFMYSLSSFYNSVIYYAFFTLFLDEKKTCHDPGQIWQQCELGLFPLWCLPSSSPWRLRAETGRIGKRASTGSIWTLLGLNIYLTISQCHPPMAI